MVTASLLAGCVPAQQGPQTAAAVPNFVFTPPSTAPIKTNMSIGILKAEPLGNLWVEQITLQPGLPNQSTVTRPRMYVDQLLSSAQKDMEKILVAKGFPTAGTYPTLDEMTYSEKQRAVLILRPTFEVNANVVRQGYGSGQTATVSGTVTLEMIEPVTREKIWLKRLTLEPFTKVLPAKPVDFGSLFSVPPQTNDTQIQDNSLILLLNTFYATAMQKVWDHLDPQEIGDLKRQVDEVRKNSTHTAHP
ncbi:hypothetical protein [Nitrospirillum amazonense]|uniref:hypothetical protein n=1 Tax=Nitrospirillum amazonense TaxID=28077 RepID=UPI0011A06EFB|nr:hypothetical protein [Nitrospirillum amazonense]